MPPCEWREGNWEAPESDKTKSAGPFVYVTRTGRAYHRGTCPTITKGRGPGFGALNSLGDTLPLSEAKRRGLKPCGVCKPAEP